MLFIWIITFVLLFFLILFSLMMNGFKNPERKHESNPESVGIEFEEVNIHTRNNKNLYGWWIMNDPGFQVIILVHGWGRNVGRMLPYIQQFNSQSYNLLVFDSRNHGHSDRDKVSTMKKFAEDISAAVDFAMEKYNPLVPDIGVVGLSIGGAAAIYASAYDNRIKSVATVGAFAHPLDIMKKQLSKRYIPYFPIGWALLNYMQLIIGLSFDKIAPENNISKANSEIFLIHGTQDKTVPFTHAERLHKQYNNKSTVWLIKERGHSDCHFEEGYWQKLMHFFNHSLRDTEQLKNVN